MRKQIFGRQLQRDINERKALFKSLMQSLIEKESIHTTEAKAKAIRGQVEKLVTKAKVNGQHTERMLSKYLSPVMVKKMIEEIAPRFATRPGGYTRIIKLGNRLRDNAKMVIIEWVEKPVALAKAEVTKEKVAHDHDGHTHPHEEVVEAEVVTDKSDKKKVTSKKKTVAKKK